MPLTPGLKAFFAKRRSKAERFSRSNDLREKYDRWIVRVGRMENKNSPESAVRRVDKVVGGDTRLRKHANLMRKAGAKAILGVK